LYGADTLVPARVRGDTTMPSLRHSSAAIRSSPPGLIRVRDCGNQVLQVLRNPGTVRAPRLPTPEEAESLTVPPHQRVGSDDGEKLSPVDHLGERDECDSGRIVQAARPDVARRRRPVACEGRGSRLRGWCGMNKSTPRSAQDHVSEGAPCESSLPVMIAAHRTGEVAGAQGRAVAAKLAM